MCFRVHVCVFGVKGGVFCPVTAPVSYGGGGDEKKRSYLPEPVHRAPVRTSCQKPTPAAFPLCLFQEILITRLRLLSVPRPPSSNSSSSLLRGLFFLYLPPFLADVTHSDTSCLLILPITRERKELPTSATCLSCLCVFIVWRIRSCLRCAHRRPSRSASKTPEPCRAFDCATVSI